MWDQLYSPDKTWADLAKERPDDKGLKMFADYERELTKEGPLRILSNAAQRIAARCGITNLGAFCGAAWWIFLFPAVTYWLIERSFHIETEGQQLLIEALAAGGLMIFAVRNS
jgi:hypothetical protein